MRIQLLAVAAFATLLVGTSYAQDRDPNEAALKYRQSVLTVMGANFGPLVGMVRGRTEFDAAEVKKRANRIRVMSTMIDEAFARDTREADLNTEALDGIWENYDDFSAKAKALTKAASALAASAEQGEGAFKKAFSKTGGSCKGCHDEYRVE